MKRALPITAAALLTLLSGIDVVPVAYASSSGSTAADPLNISQIPLFVSTAAKPNVLLVMANSNSMDENDKGLAVGSAAPTSKSEISRGVAKGLVSRYTGILNMGLEAFQQSTGGGDPVVLYNVHNSPYDASFDPAAYDPTFTGARTSATKAFRAPNLSDPGAWVYYNVNLPFYSSGNEGTGFCYSDTANAFNNGEVLWSGPWDLYACYRNKIGPSNTVPGLFDFPAAAAAGYSGLFAFYRFFPTDSDLGQGITDFGKILTWNFVSPAWFSNGSPGKGYIHVPIGSLDVARAAAFNTKLGTSQFAVNGPTDPALPLQNAGLTPLQGSLQTAKRYFTGALNGAGSASEGGPLPAPPNSCGKNFVVVVTNGLPSVKSDGTPSADVVTLLADAAAAATALQDQGVITYIVGFALPFGVSPTQLDTIAAAGGTGSSYYASNAAELQTKLDLVFKDILERTGAASAVALNSTSVSAGSYLYQAKFDAGWVGKLQQYSINPATGALTLDTSREAGARLDARDLVADPRNMITYKPTTGSGIPFRWPANSAAPTATELDLAQVSALNLDASGAADAQGQLRLNYFRGDQSWEADASPKFRVRNSRLGDIVNSAPFYVGRPSLNIRDVSYAAFRTAQASRTPMIYVGANDGFLHGFRAADGEEKLAYMPSAVYSEISKLTGQSYAHRFYVDASPNVDDAKIGGSWRTVLVSGLGAGGRGVFALDVTNPGLFASEANADNISLWEFNSSNDADLGNTYGIPAIVKLNDGNWGAIFGNGYNATGSGKSGIFVVNLATGAVIRKIMTGVGSGPNPNGIGAITAADLDGNGSADVVYGGDLTGRLWKFDLSDPLSANWGVAFSGSPLFHAVSGGNNQAITSAPEISLHPISGVIVTFGTGRYIATDDPTTTQTQSIYGVRDNGSGDLDRGDLVQQTVTSIFTSSGTQFRTMSNNAINWSSKDGWYLDLPDAGERVAVDPVLRAGRAVFTTLVPSSNPCSAGGTGWLMEVNYSTGGQLTDKPFDTNKDGVVDGSDQSAAGEALSAISSSPAVQSGYGTSASPLENKYLNQSSGNIARVLESGSRLANRRMSWRQQQ